MILKEKRRGIVLVMALVVMATLIVVLAVIAKEIVHERLMLEMRERRVQAQWLARAGVEVAAATLLESPEPFTLKEEKLAPDCVVQISVTKDQGGAFAVAVEAQCGEDARSAAISLERRFDRMQGNGLIHLKHASSAR